jgi:hypothetical protein
MGTNKIIHIPALKTAGFFFSFRVFICHLKMVTKLNFLLEIEKFRVQSLEKFNFLFFEQFILYIDRQTCQIVPVKEL